MPPIDCERCGMALAVLDSTNSEPVLRLTKGLTFYRDGEVLCPGCGCAIIVNFGRLGMLPALIAKAI